MGGLGGAFRDVFGGSFARLRSPRSLRSFADGSVLGVFVRDICVVDGLVIILCGYGGISSGRCGPPRDKDTIEVLVRIMGQWARYVARLVGGSDSDGQRFRPVVSRPSRRAK